jgi:hypothetical protein
MNFTLKKALSYWVSLMLCLPVYAEEKSMPKPDVAEHQVTPEANGTNARSPEDYLLAFVEKWNASPTWNDLMKNLNATDRQNEWIKKLKSGLSLTNQKLPRVVFNSESMHLSFDKNNKNSFHILSFAPLTVFMQNKLLVFDQNSEIEALDYLLKQFSAKPGETVFFNFILPEANAFGLAPIIWAFLGIAFLVTVVPMVTDYFSKKDREGKRDDEAIKNSAPVYRDYASEMSAQGNQLRNLSCNNERLFKLEYANSQKETWAMTFDDSSDSNDIRFLTVTAGKSVCRFVVEDEIWKRVKGMPETCRAPYRLPYQYPDHMMVESSKRCCEKSYKKCAQWVAQDLIDQKTLGSSAPEVKKSGHR